MTLAPYMEWAKHHPPARWDLSGSNLLAVTADELPGAREAVELTGLSPDGWPPLVDAIAERYGMRAENVALGGGCSGANFLAMAAVLSPGDEVLVERPAYDPLLGALTFLGARVNRFDRVFEEGWSVDPERVEAALTSRTRLIVVSSPHNPSGALVSGEALRAIGDLAAGVGARVLVDEVYLDAVYHNRPPPAATIGDVFVSTNSLTKAYGLSGLRIGWILADPAIVEAARRVRDIVDVNAAFPSECIASVAFRNLDALEKRARSILEPGLQRVRDTLNATDRFEWTEPAGGTVVFPRLKGEDDCEPFLERCREHDLLLVPGRFFDASAHFRLAFGGEQTTLASGLHALAAAARR